MHSQLRGSHSRAWFIQTGRCTDEFNQSAIARSSYILSRLQNQVSARRLDLNIIIFWQIAPTFEISILRLKKLINAKMRMVTPKYESKPT